MEVGVEAGAEGAVPALIVARRLRTVAGAASVSAAAASAAAAAAATDLVILLRPSAAATTSRPRRWEGEHAEASKKEGAPDLEIDPDDDAEGESSAAALAAARKLRRIAGVAVSPREGAERICRRQPAKKKPRSEIARRDLEKKKL